MLAKAEVTRAKTDTRLAIIGAVTKLYEYVSAAHSLNQSRIADRLGVSRSHISQLLSGPGHKNWTLDTIGELLAAMNARITRLEIKPVDEISPANEIHPWLESDARTVLSSNAVTIDGSNRPLTGTVPSSTAPTSSRLELESVM